MSSSQYSSSIHQGQDQDLQRLMQTDTYEDQDMSHAVNHKSYLDDGASDLKFVPNENDENLQSSMTPSLDIAQIRAGGHRNQPYQARASATGVTPHQLKSTNSAFSLVKLPAKLPTPAPIKPAGDANAIYSMKKIERPENFLNKNKDYSTIGMLEHLIFNVEQLKVDNYVRREPKYLFNIKDRFLNTSKGGMSKRSLTKRFNNQGKKSSGGRQKEAEPPIKLTSQRTSIVAGSHQPNGSCLKAKEKQLYTQKSLEPGKTPLSGFHQCAQRASTRQQSTSGGSASRGYRRCHSINCSADGYTPEPVNMAALMMRIKIENNRTMREIQEEQSKIQGPNTPLRHSNSPLQRSGQYRRYSKVDHLRQTHDRAHLKTRQSPLTNNQNERTPFTKSQSTNYLDRFCHQKPQTSSGLNRNVMKLIKEEQEQATKERKQESEKRLKTNPSDLGDKIHDFENMLHRGQSQSVIAKQPSEALGPIFNLKTGDSHQNFALKNSYHNKISNGSMTAFDYNQVSNSGSVPRKLNLARNKTEQVLVGLKSSKNFSKRDIREYRSFLTRKNIKQQLVEKALAKDARNVYTAVYKSQNASQPDSGRNSRYQKRNSVAHKTFKQSSVASTQYMKFTDDQLLMHRQQSASTERQEAKKLFPLNRNCSAAQISSKPYDQKQSNFSQVTAALNKKQSASKKFVVNRQSMMVLPSSVGQLAVDHSNLPSPQNPKKSADQNGKQTILATSSHRHTQDFSQANFTQKRPISQRQLGRQASNYGPVGMQSDVINTPISCQMNKLLQQEVGKAYKVSKFQPAAYMQQQKNTPGRRSSGAITLKQGRQSAIESNLDRHLKHASSALSTHDAQLTKPKNSMLEIAEDKNNTTEYGQQPSIESQSNTMSQVITPLAKNQVLVNIERKKKAAPYLQHQNKPGYKKLNLPLRSSYKCDAQKPQDQPANEQRVAKGLSLAQSQATIQSQVGVPYLVQILDNQEAKTTKQRRKIQFPINAGSSALSRTKQLNVLKLKSFSSKAQD